MCEPFETWMCQQLPRHLGLSAALLELCLAKGVFTEAEWRAAIARQDRDWERRMAAIREGGPSAAAVQRP